jgi:N-acetyl-anhydromuramyl-L-alanine amidase AmpD
MASVGNYGVGRRNPISRITWHHIAGDAPGAIARFQTAGVQVSATYVIGSDGTLYQCVDEANTPYSDGNADSNSRTISIECAGGIASVPYTEAMYATAVDLCRDLIPRYGITDFKRHRDVIDKTVYPGGTECPGTLDVERIITHAKEGSMSLQADLDLMTYKFDESQKALKIREQLTDLLQYKLDQSEAALRTREQQAADYEAQIAALQSKSKYTVVTEPLYRLAP